MKNHLFWKLRFLSTRESAISLNIVRNSPHVLVRSGSPEFSKSSESFNKALLGMKTVLE